MAQTQVRKKQSLLTTLKKERSLHLMLLPAIIILIIYRYIPMFGIVIVFKKYVPALGFLKSKWVGLKNFETLFTTPGFFEALRNTVIISVAKLTTGVIVPVIFALLLNEVRLSAVKRAIQTIIYLPHFVSWVLMAGIIIEILDPAKGMLNHIIKAFGGTPIFFMGNVDMIRPILVITNVWKEFGYQTIVYMAALTAVDPSLYEAASIDGAGHISQMFNVTLPCILPTVLLMAMLALGSVLDAGFDQVFNLVKPITMEKGDILDTLVYRLGIEGGQFSISTAASLFKSVFSCLLLVTSYKLAYKFSGYQVF